MGFEAYVPVKMGKRSHSRKVVMKEIPIMPTYVFFVCKIEETRIIRSISGVASIVHDNGFTGPYARIPDSQVKNIMEIYDRIPDKITFSTDLLRNGTRVKVTSGILAGIEGEVTDFDGARDTTTLYLRVSTLGCAKVEVDLKCLEISR